MSDAGQPFTCLPLMKVCGVHAVHDDAVVAG